MKVLAVASEAYPLVKTGGLADVVGALPRALLAEDVEVRTLLPGYPSVLAGLSSSEFVHELPLYGGPARLLAGRGSGLDLFVIDAPHIYNRVGNPYVAPNGGDWPDNAIRFAALGSIAAEIARGLVPTFQPDVVHAHDWQAGLAPAYMHFRGARAKSVVTVHNIAFQGLFAADIFPALDLPQSAFSIDGVEYYGGVSYLKAALQLADAITTVSPTYAEEICGAAFGMGFEGLLRRRHDRLHGILNGIDTDVWSPDTDPALAYRFDADRLEARAHNKRAVQERFGLDDGDQPLYCVVSRLTWQKGMDLLLPVLDRLVATGARLALLGSGDASLEQAFRTAAGRHAQHIGTIIGYDDALSHLMMGGADAILVPSRFEPCGLTQMQGLRYGCVPVVSRVGGLADTVIDANEAAMAAGVANGIQFAPDDEMSLEQAIHRANRLFADKDVWRTLQINGMRSDVSWRRSARRYALLYRDLVDTSMSGSGPAHVT